MMRLRFNYRVGGKQHRTTYRAGRYGFSVSPYIITKLGTGNYEVR